ncbi:MAG: hypothetical protein LHV68_04575 [Elusimicrobia bacterium]|nr:hypothetical protein [Candidatus Liberimonas magnetica]
MNKRLKALFNHFYHAVLKTTGASTEQFDFTHCPEFSNGFSRMSMHVELHNKSKIYFKKYMFFIVFALCLLTHYTLSITPVFGAFKDSGWGVRPAGMGGAFVAVADDSNASLYNPGGIAQISKNEVTFMSSRLFTGLEGVDLGLNYLSYVHPLNKKYGSLSLTWSSLFSPGLYREDTGNFTYGRLIKKDLALGVNAKYLRKEYTLDVRTYNDPVFESGSSKDAVTFDAGFLFFVPKTDIKIGLVSKNITKPDMGLKTQDVVESENTVGVSYYNAKLPFLKLPYFTFALDYVSRADVVDVRSGLETWLFDGRFAVRLGCRTSEISTGLGYEISLSSKYKLVIDYAFGLPLEIQESTGSHRIGVTMRF